MNTQGILSALFAAALMIAAGAPAPARADDAEIYIVRPDQIPESSQPLIMFSLDYRSNLGSTACQGGVCDFLIPQYMESKASYTFFDMLRGVLRYVFEAPLFGGDEAQGIPPQPLSGVKIGLMLNHNYNNGCEGPDGNRPGCSNGGYIAMGFREATSAPGDNTKGIFRDLLASMPSPQGNQSHSFQGRELFFEFHRYLEGMTVYNGFNGYTSYDTQSSQGTINIDPQFAARWAAPSLASQVNGFAWDPATIEADGVTYRSPLGELGACSSIYTINFMFQVSSQESDSNSEIASTIGLPANCQGPGCDFAAMIEFMNRQDYAPTVDGLQGVTSYFIGAEPNVRNNTFKAYASAGGTGSALPLSEDPQLLVEAIAGALKEILSISTTFTAAALPVNSFDRANVLDDVFLALFQPQNKLFPANNAYWWGNIKKLRLTGLGSATEVVELRDARDQPAVAADGRIRFDALTFWTDPAGADVIDNLRDPDSGAVTGRDGRSVNRGGGGHKKPGFERYPNYNPGAANPLTVGIQPQSGPRRIFYDSGPDTLAPLNETAAVSLQAAIGAADAAEAAQVVNFMRGRDEFGEPLDWMFGSVMHSRPVPVNYGARDGHTQSNPMIYVAAGGNDGALRFILNTDSSGNERGQEIWSFIPSEVMRHVRSVVREESPSGRPGHEGDSTIYGFDGPATLFVDDVNGDGTLQGNTDKAILFAGLRRGGRAYYALDVSNPLDPRLLWRIVGGQGDEFDNLGWTFSQPRVGRMELPTEGVVPVLVFAGGYDRAYDDETGAIPDQNNVLGRGIYVVNGTDGSLIRHVVHDEMHDSIPSTVTAVDTDGNGLMDRIYVGDLGGRVWRVDMTPAGDSDQWAVSMLADLGRRATGAAPGGPEDRRFYNPPDVVQTKKRFEIDDVTSETLKFDAVLIGSGDRENPVHNVPNNWFFMIRDLNTGILSEADDTVHKLEDFTDVTNVTGEDVPISSPGWALQLITPGEKNLAASVTVANTVFFTTYIPPGASTASVDRCGPVEGTGRLYTVSLQNANPPRNRDDVINDGDVLDPSDRWEALKSGGIPAEVVVIPPDRILRPDLQVDPVPIMTRWRTFWYAEEDPVQ